jgi:hypothetical protein
MKAVQEVLRQLVAELIDVRSQIAVLCVQPCNEALAQDAKRVSISESRESYTALLEKIEKLA